MLLVGIDDVQLVGRDEHAIPAASHRLRHDILHVVAVAVVQQAHGGLVFQLGIDGVRQHVVVVADGEHALVGPQMGILFAVGTDEVELTVVEQVDGSVVVVHVGLAHHAEVVLVAVEVLGVGTHFAVVPGEVAGIG